MTRHEKRVPTYQIYPSNVQLGVILSARVLLRILSVQKYPSVIPYSIPCQSTLLFECLTRSYTIITPQLTINIHITKITGPDSHIIYTPWELQGPALISHIYLGNYRAWPPYHIHTPRELRGLAPISYMYNLDYMGVVNPQIQPNTHSNTCITFRKHPLLPYQAFLAHILISCLLVPF